MNKKIIFILVGIIVLIGIFFWLRPSQPKQEQAVLEKTLEISKEYASLRYQTDNVLINAKDYGDYDAGIVLCQTLSKTGEN